MSSSPAHISDIGGFIFFSPRTVGYTGRPIKIHTNLFIDFLCALNPHSADGQMVIRDIESLRALAQNTTTAKVPPKDITKSTGNAAANYIARRNKIRENLAAMNHRKNMARENSLITKNVRVYYNINQREWDAYPTVYISEVQIINKGKSEIGGFYENKAGMYNTTLGKVDKCNLEGKTVFLSGATKAVNDAMKDAKATTKNINPTLFFSPMSVTEDLTVWKANRLTSSTKKLIDELSTTIRDNQKHTVNWVVAGEGAALLAHAVKTLSGSLEKHSFKFINGKANLPELVKNLGQRNAQLNGDFIATDKTHATAAFASTLAIASQKQALVAQIAALPKSNTPIASQNMGNDILRMGLMTQISATGKIGMLNTITALPQALRGSKTTFVDVLMTVRKK